jgi:CheY-like chemotaxis protein
MGMRERRLCVVLLNLSLPMMDGWQFREHQVQHPQLAHVPVSAWRVQIEEVERLRRLSCVEKPVDLPSLLRHVDRACRARSE